MKKYLRLPTLLALTLLVIGFTGGLMLVEKGPDLFSQASSTSNPSQIKITNLSDSGFTVSWITNKEATGFVTYGETSSLGQTIRDDRDQLSGKTDVFINHYVTLRNLKAQTTYYYRINSTGQNYEITTANKITTSLPQSDVATGIVLNADTSPSKGAIVYFNMGGMTPQSALVRSSGDWFISLNNAYSADLQSFAVYNKDSQIENIYIQGANNETAQITTTTKNDNPVPEIVLGKTYDFRAEENSTSGVNATLTPSITLRASPTPTAISKFSLDGNYRQPVDNAENLSIINPDQNEIINTQSPEFFGTGLSGKTVKIIVNSPTKYTGTASVNDQGEWRWTPPAPLPPGEHTIQITVGNLTITKTFNVLAAEGDLPAYTATASGQTPTPTLKLTPTPTLTPSPTLRASPTPTPVTNLQPGLSTPTIFLFGFGWLLIFISLFCYVINRQYERQ